MRDLTRGNEAKVIVRFAIPMLLGNVLQQMYHIVDTIIVGNYIGKQALGAVGASFPIIFVMVSLIIGISSGITIVIAQYFGAKNILKVKQAIDTMYVFLFFASFLVAIAGISFSGYIFRLIDLPEEIIPYAKSYFNIFSGGIITLFGFNSTSAVLRGLGDSKTPLFFLIISTLLNVGLDLLFVLVFGWGIKGVAYATIIAQGLSFLLAVLYLNKYHQLIKISFVNLDFNKDVFYKSIRIGLPTGLQQMFVALGMMALFRIVNIFGTNVVAAYSVAGRIDSFAVMPSMNFSAALSTFVGQNLGAKKPQRVRKGMLSTFAVTASISITITAIAFLFGKELMDLFTDDPKVIQIGKEYLQIVSAFYIVFSSMFVFTAVFRGAGDTIPPMIITLFSLWLIRIPASYFLSLSFEETGIWMGIPSAWLIGMIFSAIYYKTGKWKNKVVTRTLED